MKHRKEQFIYVGVDLHKRTHTAVVINCWNEKLQVITFENKPAVFPDMVAQVKRHVIEGQTIVFGLEDVGGYGRALASVSDGKWLSGEGSQRRQFLPMYVLPLKPPKFWTASKRTGKPSEIIKNTGIFW